MTLLIKNTLWLFLASAFLLPVEWTVFKSSEGQFSILAPGEITQDKKTIETDIGTIDYHSFYHAINAGEEDNTVFAVSYCEYPKYTVHSDSTDMLLDFFATTVAQSIPEGGKLVYESPEQIDGFPGRLWRTSYDEFKIVKSKAFLVENRFYLIQVFSNTKRANRRDGDKFLESFRLYKPTVAE